MMYFASRPLPVGRSSVEPDSHTTKVAAVCGFRPLSLAAFASLVFVSILGVGLDGLAAASALTAAPSPEDTGSTYTLAWTTTNATTVTIDPGVGTVPPSGSVEVAPTVTTTYTLTATGPGGSATRSIVVNVADSVPTIVLTATPQTIDPWEATTLEWTATNAASVEMAGIPGGLPLTGSVEVKPDSTTIYTVTAVAADGSSAEATITVAVNSALAAETTRLVVPADGGDIAEASGDEEVASVLGHGRILNESVGSAMTGIAMVRFRQNGVLVNETGVPLSAEMRSGIMPVQIVSGKRRGRKSESTDAVNAAVALSNQTGRDAVVSFRLNNSDGTSFGQNSFALGSNTQIAVFFDQEPFNAPKDWEGTVEFASTEPVVVTALRTVLNKRGEFLYTNVRVADLPAGGESLSVSGQVLVPFVATGDGWTTQVALTNTSDEVQSGSLRFFGQTAESHSAVPIQLTVDGVPYATYHYSLAPHSALHLTLGDASESIRVGSARIIPDASRVPSTVAILSYSINGTIVSEASVSPEPVGSSFRAFAESSGGVAAVGSVHSSFAITNTGEGNNVVWLAVSDLDGVPLNFTRSLTLSPGGQIVRFMHELFPELPPAFRGVVRISADAPVAVFAGRTTINERGERIFGATPPRNDETDSLRVAESFPFFASGAGYATEFVVFGGSNQTLSAELALLAQDGSLVPAAGSSTGGGNSGKGKGQGKNK